MFSLKKNTPATSWRSSVRAGSLSSDEMQQIARETNFSETTFILQDEQRDGGYDVRIFTPGEEVPFAGHPTLGTATFIRNEILKGKAEALTLNLKVGKIPVTFGQDGYTWMKQIEPEFGKQHPVEAIASILGLPVCGYRRSLSRSRKFPRDCLFSSYR